MLTFESNRGVRQCDGVTRRDFLRVGTVAVGAAGLSLENLLRLTEVRGRQSSDDRGCILLFLVGGPSQIDTWDPKPDAPESVRGPFRAIQTSAPGIQISEAFPFMATMAHRYAIVRSVHHTAAPLHEYGHQLLQTGRLVEDGVEHPHYGAVLSHLRGPTESGVPPFAVLPGPIGNTGVNVSHGQGAGYLGATHQPWFPFGPGAGHGFRVMEGSMQSPGGTLANLGPGVDSAHRLFEFLERSEGTVCEQAYGSLFASRAKQAFELAEEPTATRARYGEGTFGQSCLLARRLIERGVRLVTVNMFDTVFNQVTWDCHADGGSLATTLEDYRETLCPTFDKAYTALLEDLSQRGMLASTLVLAMGEFGRTPWINPRGGRDHWTGVWSALFAGAGVRGGQVIGASDALGSAPTDRPVTPAEVAATVYRVFGIDRRTLLPGPHGRVMPIVDGEPIHDLFEG